MEKCTSPYYNLKSFTAVIEPFLIIKQPTYNQDFCHNSEGYDDYFMVHKTCL